ncbi:CLUMA_CG016635, isoform A [Clunio marinus]|uniref:CLUMA_CG016635, isoform A n=1 Tax=Clunio marinus TaxID=568069 RepID=A0A1J1IVC2_9DIPT|nr:CLUMA_CG016635, isoform A [Clunio marinus]
MASIMMNISNIRYEAVDQEVNLIIQKQAQVMLKASINDYIASIRSMTEAIKENHLNIIEFKPVTELNAFMDEATLMKNVICLPTLRDSEDIFTFKQPKKKLKNNIVQLEFIIPLVSCIALQEYLIINIPTPKILNAVLPKDALIIKIIVDDKNSTGFLSPPTKNQLGIFDVEPEKLDECLKFILQKEKSDKCLTKFNDGVINQKLLQIDESLAVLIKGQDDGFNLTCTDQTSTIIHYEAALVNFTDCIIIGKNSLLKSEQFHSIYTTQINLLHNNNKGSDNVLHFTKLSNFTSPNVEVLKKELEKTLSDMKTTSKYKWTTGLGVGIWSSTFLTISLLIIGGLFYFKKKKTNSLTPPVEHIRTNWIEEWLELNPITLKMTHEENQQ